MKLKHLAAATMMIITASQGFAEEIRISGGAAPMNNIYKQIKDKFEEKTKIKLVLTEQAPEKALEGLQKGTFDVASAGLDWNDWLALCKEKGVEIDSKKLFRQSPVSRDTIVVLANKDSKVSKLSQDDLAKIFTGEVKNWKQFTGEDAPIEVVFSDGISGTNKFFAKTIFPGKNFRSDLIKAENADGIAAKISESKNRIGFGPVSMLSKKDFKIKQVETMEITRPVLFVFLNASDAVVKLRDFILSPEGKALIKR